jgi:hypothetical protein
MYVGQLFDHLVGEDEKLAKHSAAEQAVADVAN